MVNLTWATLLAFVFLAISGCSEQQDSPESQLRSALDNIQQAAEQRSMRDFMVHISEDYTDKGDRDIKQVRAMVQLQFLRNPKIHVFKRITSLTLHSDTQATVSLLVALAGRPIDNASALSGLRADLMRFDLDLSYTDSWRVTRAEWSPADAADFL